MCIGVSCQTNNSLNLIEILKKEIEKRNIEEYVRVIPNGCFGMCQKGPSMFIFHETLGPIRYVHVNSKEDIINIIENTLIGNKIIDKYYIEQYLRED